jgi:hypothetical protein
MAGNGRSSRADPRGFGLSDEDLRALGYTVGSAEGVRDPGTTDEPGAVSTRRAVDPAVRLWIATLLTLSSVAWLALPTRYLPAPVVASAPDSVFSSARALSQLVELARAPRPIGSPENARVRDHLLSRLTMLGVEAKIQTATVANGVGEDGRIVSATVRNVVGRIPGSASEGSVVLLAPYDGPPLSEAAGRAVGMVAALETVRALSSGPPPKNDVVVVFTDGDAVGGLGSRAFFERHRWANDALVVVSADAFGAAGAAFPFGEGAADASTQEALASARTIPGPSSVPSALATLGPSVVGSHAVSDESPPQITFVALGDISGSGQPFDTRDRITEETLQHAGAQVLTTVRSFATREPDRGSREARASAWVPFVGSISLPLNLAWPVSAGAIVGFGVLLLLLRGRGGGLRGTLAGAGVGLGVVALSGWLAQRLFGFLAGYHSEIGSVAGGVYRDAPHVFAILGIAVAVATSAYALARRWFRADEICAGALVVPVALSPWITLQTPLGTLALHLPLAFAAAAVAMVTLVGPGRISRWWVWSSVLVLQSIVVLLLTPSVAVAGGLWTFAEAQRLGAVTGIALLLLLPAAEWLIRPRSWWTAALAAGVAAVAVALPTMGSSVNHPDPSTLIYLADEPVVSPLAAMLPGQVLVDSGGPRRMAGQWLTVPGPGEYWARTWAVGAPSGASPGLLLLPREDEHILIGGGPVSELVAPTVEVGESRVEDGRRLVSLSIRPGLSGEMIGLHVNLAAGRLTGVEETDFGAEGRATTLVHWGAAPGGVLRFTADVGIEVEEIEFTVVEHHLRPMEVLPGELFERGDSLIPNVATGSDRVIQRTVLRVAVGEPEVVGGEPVVVGGEPSG